MKMALLQTTKSMNSHYDDVATFLYYRELGSPEQLAGACLVTLAVTVLVSYQACHSTYKNYQPAHPLTR